MYDLPSTVDEARLRSEELRLWKEFYGDGPMCRQHRVSVRKCFTDMFPGGHSESIKQNFTDFLELVQSGKTLERPLHILSGIHPRPWDLILQHGRDYVPSKNAHKVYAHEVRQPAQTYCFLNSYELMKTIRLNKPTARITYVEGFVYGPMIPPMLHAWNGAGFSKNSVDWTLYSVTRWSRYFGIPFTYEEYQHLIEVANPESPSVMMLFRADNFEKVEECIRKILSTPRKRHPKVKTASIV